MRRATWAVVLTAVSGLLAYGEEPKKAQSGASEGVAAVRAKKSTARLATDGTVAPDGIAGSGEVVATNFTVQSGTCVRADSSIDFVSSNNVSITLLSNNGTDMSATRIIPFFAVADGSFYVSSGTIISASTFYYFDGGGATVPVQGRFLRIRICNDANFDVNYAQLTARGSGTAN